MSKIIRNTILFKAILILLFSSSVFAQDLQLEDIWQSQKYSPKGVNNFISMNDGNRFVKLEDNEIVSYDFKTGKDRKVILSNNDLIYGNGYLKMNSFIFSNDEKKVLILSDTKRIYRHSTQSSVYLYDFDKKELITIFGQNAMYPTFSPDGNMVAAVINNNIFIRNLQNNELLQATFDGKINEIINGAVDWVYEEEFSMNKGFEWSPDGKYIAFMRFDEKNVREYSLEIYNDKNYPEIYKYKYPKAGEDNSVVSIKVIELETFASNEIMSTKADDSYLPRIQWAGDNLLFIQKFNRHQNHFELWKYELKSFKNEMVYEEDNEFYIDINDKIYFDKSANNFVFLSEQNGWNQIFQYNINSKKLSPITESGYDVDQIEFYDSDNGVVYYSSAEESPAERQLYKIDIKKSSKIKLSQGSGWHSCNFTKSGLYYLNIFSDFSTPPVYTLFDKDGNSIRVLEDNKELKDLLKKEKFGKYSFGELTTENGDKLNYWQILPPNFKEKNKYPVLFYVYGGPGSQTVKNSWGGANYLWYQMLAQKGYIIMSVDNRGTGFRGEKFKKCTYLNLGKIESDDQIASAKWISQKPYVDKDRIGIWGWSYGGFMSTLCLSRGNDIFKTAIAVAPVSSWRFYDNIYTERYMRTPIENEDGYFNYAPLNFAQKIKGNYLLVHGTADDNVHPQNAIELINVMIKNNVSFDSEFYPNRNHGIYGGNTRFHLYNRMTNFILEKL